MRKLLAVINQEDKKNPLTDDAIAKQLGMRRNEVIKLRKSLGIGNSRERAKDLLAQTINDLFADNPQLSERGLTQKLNEIGFNISRHAVGEFCQQLKPSGECMTATVANSKDTEKQVVTDETSAFDGLIGAYNSLRTQIELAKAAVLYPTKGLHTLISGPTGVGKSELAYCMYQFARESGSKANDSSFVVFNCADYAETPQLLMAQLFGYVKGAFTGAETDREGLVERADQGILFLDEIHRLPPEGQEILYYLIDKGKFRRLGESDAFRTANLMLIAATTENIESFLLLPFRRRIPVVIELPGIAKRPLEERFKIIVSFIREEASRIKLAIRVSYNAVIALLLYDCPGNIGQLRSDIQVACARAFLKHMAEKQEILEIEINDLAHQVVKGLLYFNSQRPIVERFLQGDLEISPTDEPRISLAEPAYLLPNEIYQEIENNYSKMESQGIDISIINRVISDELEVKVKQLIKHAKGKKQNLIRQDLEKIVGKQIVYVVERMMKLAKTRLPDIDDSLFYCLSTHLAASYERIQLNNRLIVNPQLQTLKEEYPVEYELAAQMVQIGSYYLEIELPEDEIAFITMYLKSYANKEHFNESHVGVVVLTHGHVAEGMAQVANRLLGVEHAKAIEMPLEESSEHALQRATQLVKQSDSGKGVLMLADMGSLVGFGKLITDSTGIVTRTITRVNTPMVIEAVRKALLPDMQIDEIANALQWDNLNYEAEECSLDARRHLPTAIVTICLTGKGGAEWIAKSIRDYMPDMLQQIKIITLGALVEEDLQSYLVNLKQQYNLLAIIGTLHTIIPGVPFITAREFFKEQGLEKLKKLITLRSYSQSYREANIDQDNHCLSSLLLPELVLLKASCSNKQEALNTLAQLLVSTGRVREQYVVSVYERETLAHTIFQDVALPHGSSEYIIKPAIAVMTLEQPIEWIHGHQVEMICMLALNNYQKDEFKKLYVLLNNRDTLSKLKQSKNIEDFMRVITDGKMF